MPKFVTLKEFLDLFSSICNLLVALSLDILGFNIPSRITIANLHIKCYFPKNDITL